MLNGSVEEGETGALVGNVTNDIRRVAKSPSYPEGGQSRQTKHVDIIFLGAVGGRLPHCFVDYV